MKVNFTKAVVSAAIAASCAMPFLASAAVDPNARAAPSNVMFAQYLDVARQAYQAAILKNGTPDALDEVDSIRFYIALAHNAEMMKPIRDEWYAEADISLTRVREIEKKSALATAKILYAKKDIMNINIIRNVETHLNRAGFKTGKGEGFAELNTDATAFAALKREHAIKDAMGIVAAMRKGTLPKFIRPYTFASDRADAGYSDNEEWYKAIGTTMDEFRSYVQIVCAKDAYKKACPVTAPGVVGLHDHHQHHNM